MIKNPFDIIIIIFFLSQVFYMFFLSNKLKENFNFEDIPKNDPRFKNLEIVSKLITEIKTGNIVMTGNPKINLNSIQILGTQDATDFDYEEAPTKNYLHLNKLKLKENSYIRNLNKI